MGPEPGRRRRIRSFVLRAGRTTPAQQRALDELWPAYGIDFGPEPVDFATVFGREAPTVLEIGFGNGQSLIEQAARHPERNFIGIEVHRPGIGHCLLGIRRSGIENLRLIEHDALEVLERQFADGSLDRINLYFPDPWPKKRHHKRRIVNPPFLGLAARKLARGGTLHIATDWANYAEQIDELIGSSGLFRVVERREHGGEAPLDRPPTKFERRGLARGHRIWDWIVLRS